MSKQKQLAAQAAKKRSVVYQHQVDQTSRNSFVEPLSVRLFEHYHSHNPSQVEKDSHLIDEQRNSIINDLLDADLKHESSRVSNLIKQLRQTTAQRRRQINESTSKIGSSAGRVSAKNATGNASSKHDCRKSGTLRVSDNDDGRMGHKKSSLEQELLQFQQQQDDARLGPQALDSQSHEQRSQQLKIESASFRVHASEQSSSQEQLKRPPQINENQQQAESDNRYILDDVQKSLSEVYHRPTTAVNSSPQIARHETPGVTDGLRIYSQSSASSQVRIQMRERPQTGEMPGCERKRASAGGVQMMAAGQPYQDLSFVNSFFTSKNCQQRNNSQAVLNNAKVVSRPANEERFPGTSLSSSAQFEVGNELLQSDQTSNIFLASSKEVNVNLPTFYSKQLKKKSRGSAERRFHRQLVVGNQVQSASANNFYKQPRTVTPTDFIIKNKNYVSQFHQQRTQHHIASEQSPEHTRISDVAAMPFTFEPVRKQMHRRLRKKSLKATAVALSSQNCPVSINSNENCRDKRGANSQTPTKEISFEIYEQQNKPPVFPLDSNQSLGSHRSNDSKGSYRKAAKAYSSNRNAQSPKNSKKMRSNAPNSNERQQKLIKQINRKKIHEVQKAALKKRSAKKSATSVQKTSANSEIVVLFKRGQQKTVTNKTVSREVTASQSGFSTQLRMRESEKDQEAARLNMSHVVCAKGQRGQSALGSDTMSQNSPSAQTHQNKSSLLDYSKSNNFITKSLLQGVLSKHRQRSAFIGNRAPMSRQRLQNNQIQGPSFIESNRSILPRGMAMAGYLDSQEDGAATTHSVNNLSSYIQAKQSKTAMPSKRHALPLRDRPKQAKFVGGFRLEKHNRIVQQQQEAERLKWLEDNPPDTSLTERQSLHRQRAQQCGQEDLSTPIQNVQLLDDPFQNSINGDGEADGLYEDSSLPSDFVIGEYRQNKEAIRLSTFEKESSLPPITDVNDQLSRGSQLAAMERHGVTQYKLNDSSKVGSIQSLEYIIPGVETDKQRQKQLDKKYSLCYNNIQNRKKVTQSRRQQDKFGVVAVDLRVTHQSISDLVEEDAPALTMREEHRNRCSQSALALSTQQSRLVERLATSRGFTCGQCTQCIKANELLNRPVGVMPTKLHISQAIGNSNLQKMEVLKPKWAQHQVPSNNAKLEEESAVAGGEEAKSVIVFKATVPATFEKQLPMLVAAYGLYTDKCAFKPGIVPQPDALAVSKRFTRTYLLSSEKACLAQKYDRLAHIDAEKLAIQIQSRLIQYAVCSKGDDEYDKFEILRVVPVRVDSVTRATLEQMRSINQLIYQAEHEEYMQTFCCDPAQISDQTLALADDSTKKRSEPAVYKCDSMGLFDPNFADQTFIEPKQTHLLEVAVLVIAQFKERICRWMTRKAAARRRVDSLLVEVSESQKKQMDIEDSQLSARAALEELASPRLTLEFFDLDKITEPRSRHSRDEVYQSSQKRLQELAAECEEYGMLTDELRERAYNTDYEALKALNEQYEDVFEMADVRPDQYQEFVRVFDDFFHRHKSVTQEVCERIEEETAPQIEAQVTRLNPDFFRKMSDQMASVSEIDEKCRSYSDHIYSDFKPLEELEEPENQMLFQKWRDSEEIKSQRTRENFEDQIYQGWALQLLPDTEIDWLMVKPSNVFDAKLKLRQLQNQLKKFEEYDQVVSLEPKTRKDITEEIEHKAVVEKYMERITPVDRKMSSNLFAVSFYREEFVRQEISEDAPSSEQNGVKEAGKEGDARENDEQGEEVDKVEHSKVFGPRTQVFQVYSLTSSPAHEQASWISNDLYRDMVKDLHCSLIEESIRAREEQRQMNDELKDEFQIRQERQRKSNLLKIDRYVETVRQMYRNDLFMKVSHRREARQSLKYTSAADSTSGQDSHRQGSQERTASSHRSDNAKAAAQAMRSEKARGETGRSGDSYQQELLSKQNRETARALEGQAGFDIGAPQDVRLAAIQEQQAEEDKQSMPSITTDSADIVLGLTKRTSKASIEAGLKVERNSVVSLREEVSNSVQGGRQRSAMQRSQGGEGQNKRERNSEFSDLSEDDDEYDDEDDDHDDQGEEVRAARQDLLDRLRMLPAKENSSALEMKFRRRDDWQQDRVHNMLKMEQKLEVIPEPEPKETEEVDEVGCDLVVASEAEDVEVANEKRDALFALLELQQPPVQSVHDAKSFLTHPDNDQFNSWIELESRDLCYRWQDQQKLNKTKRERYFKLDSEEEQMLDVKSDEQTSEADNLAKSRQRQNIMGSMLKFVQENP